MLIASCRVAVRFSETLLEQNSPDTCLHQTSKVHHQVSFSEYKVAKFEFERQYRRIPTHKECKCEEFCLHTMHAWW